jgi:hypothetical protein
VTQLLALPTMAEAIRAALDVLVIAGLLRWLGVEFRFVTFAKTMLALMALGFIRIVLT